VFDLTSTWMSTATKGANKGSLIAHLRINKLPSEAQLLQDSGGKTTVYQVLFWFNNKVYFAQLEVAGQARAWAGQPGYIPTDAGVAKIATYDQDPSITQTIPFKYTPSKEGAPGKIDMTIPASLVGNPKPGSRLYRVTGFVHTLAGSIGGETLMDERDSASSFFWDFGKPRRADGRVVVSVDDPTFKHSRVVRPSSPSKRWAVSLSLARVAKGAHTVYVREAAGPFRSRTVTAHFRN
jgi:hypothetical protein